MKSKNEPTEAKWVDQQNGSLLFRPSQGGESDRLNDVSAVTGFPVFKPTCQPHCVNHPTDPLW